MKTFSLTFALLLGFAPLVDCLYGQAPKEGDGRGVVIIALKEGPTRFLDAEGKVLPDAKTVVGATLPEGNAAQAGVGGKIILLLSNGTVMTLESETMLKIREFTQEPFDAGGRKVEDLKEEPSKSNVKLDLDWGSIVVGTKKLDRDSSLDISSPTGTAGIRGTQFQMSQKPGTGVKLDVTESTVAFTPSGADRPVAVGPGQGLDVSAAGVSTPRPINPGVARNINVSNNAAVQATNEVPLGAVSDAMTEATVEAAERETSSREGGGKGGDDPGGDGKGGDDPGGDGKGGDGGRKDARGEDTRGDGTRRDRGRGEGGSAGRGADSSARAAPTVDTSQVLENNADARQSRKTGKVNPRASEVTRLALTDGQAEIFYSYGAVLQDALLAVGPEATKRLLGLTDKGISGAHLTTFFGYGQEIRAKMLGLADDTTLANLMAKQYEEAWLTAILSDQNLLAMNAGQTPEAAPATTSQESFLALNDNLRESGNSEILEELLEVGGGTLTDELLREGEVANQLLADFSSAGDLSGASIVNGQDALSNRFYQDVASLYETLEGDALVAGQAAFLGGSTLTLATGAYSLSGLDLGGADALAFGAVDRLRLEGSIQFSGDAGAGKRIVVMSGNELDTTSALTLDAATNDLVLSVRRDVVLEGAVLRGAREVAIRSLQDLSLRNSEISASDLATLKAAKDLYLDGLNFNANLPKIVMEATTIRLMNINFPANAAINLNSLKGPIDGRYPNFGTNVSTAQQLGRVNFLQNVKAGGNLMDTRTSFDLFGGNITIGKTR